MSQLECGSESNAIDGDVVRATFNTLFGGAAISQRSDVFHRPGLLAVHDLTALAAPAIARSVPHPDLNPESIWIGSLGSNFKPGKFDLRVGVVRLWHWDTPETPYLCGILARLLSLSKGLGCYYIVVKHMVTVSALGNDMPTGPRGERRPADVIGAAIMVAKIATGEFVEDSKSKSGRVRSGHAGAKARADSLSSAQRELIARKAAAARWRDRNG
jgi:hypothetical protein